VRVLLLLAVAAAPFGLAGCDGFLAGGQFAARPATPLPFRTDLERTEDRRVFVVTVEARGAGLDALRESVRFEATRYCLATVGSSATLWETDPATGDWRAMPQGDRLAFRARCVGGA
jgi:hypothetical protein